MIDRKREEIQNQALNAWLETKRATCEIITGLGKTFIAFKAILTMPKESNILFLAETTVNLIAA